MFFETVHGEHADQTVYPQERTKFGIDFLLGLLHFTFFFGWAGALVSHTTGRLGLTTFLRVHDRHPAV